MSKNTVKIHNNTLVLSATNAIDPVVWRLDLGAHPSCAFEIKSTAKQHKLMMKSGDVKAAEVAKFSKKDDAVNALIQITTAMEEMDEQTSKTMELSERGAKSKKKAIKSKKKPINKRRAGVIVGLMLFIAALIYIWISILTNHTLIQPQQALNANVSANNAAIDPSQASGVPVSADDFLNAQ